MAETPKVRVAAAQIAPDLDTPGGTVSKVLGALTEAAERGARLVVFPGSCSASTSATTDRCTIPS